MDRKCSVIGFLGIDKYEYIQYISRVLYHLGKKVLLVDCSETGALSYSVSAPRDLDNIIIEYRGVKFLDNHRPRDRTDDWPDILEAEAQDYDIILVDYGYRTDAGGLKQCDRIICVTDQQAHNIARLSGLNPPKDAGISLIVKNVVNHRITAKYIINELKLEHIPAKQIYVVFQDEIDECLRMNCQYDQIVRFSGISTQSKSVIKGLIEAISPEAANKELREAYKKAEKGR